jgi:hydroxymethylbilane synthase
MKSVVRIATRRSPLALWQAEHVASRLRGLHPGLRVELIPMVTEGDRVLDRALATVGGKGLFIKELEVAIFEDRADIAVHSMKDVPADLPEGMTLAAALTRADPRDAFVSNRFARFADLPQRARVGTSSQRRQCQLRALRPDLEIGLLRGNVQTRLRKLDEGEFDAIILAAAGLLRLDLGARISESLDPAQSVPAVGQGIIGIECESADVELLALLAPLEDATARTCLTAERAFAARLQGSCTSPVAGHARLDGERLQLTGLVGSPDGREVIRDEATGIAAAAAALGTGLADRLLERGAGKLLAALRDAHP